MSKILVDKAVLEQALDALEDGIEYNSYGDPYSEEDMALQTAGKNIRAALEQPQIEQEPVAWISPSALEWITRESEKVVKLTRKAQPEYDFTEPLYTNPQPPHQPVTNEQMDIGWELHGSSDAYQAWCMTVEWTERAHNIKEQK